MILDKRVLLTDDYGKSEGYTYSTVLTFRSHLGIPTFLIAATPLEDVSHDEQQHIAQTTPHTSD